MNRHPHFDLEAIARQAMIDQGLLPEFPKEVREQLRAIEGPAPVELPGVRDLRSLPWCSIDNDDSRDLDQLSTAESLERDRLRIYVAVADVDVLVPTGSPIDRYAAHNTTSVYTPGKVFSMLPEELSTDFTSLNPDVDRLAVVVEMVIDAEGNVEGENVFHAAVRNHAKLAYNAVGAWLAGEEGAPQSISGNDEIDERIRVQDRAAQRLKKLRHEEGALDFQTIEAKAEISDGRVVGLREEKPNRAKELIEDFMIAANGATARFLARHRFPSLRRVVRSPERWERIITLAREYGGKLPGAPDSAALEEFLIEQKKRDPLRFPDLSLSVIKLMGRGEYVAEQAGQRPAGHFGLAVRDYTHSTAPNRRYPDLITQRLLKAALASEKNPYGMGQLHAIAAQCTKQEDAANKVERLTLKAAAAILLADEIGRRFDAVVTGASAKGTWVRILHPPVEGKVVRGAKGLDVGDRVKVELIATDPERGYIDFAR